MKNKKPTLRQMLRDVLAPLIEADGGQLYLVSATDKEVALHLAGTFSGSPATDMTTERIVQPAVHAVMPNAKVIVSSGFQIPDGAQPIAAAVTAS